MKENKKRYFNTNELLQYSAIHNLKITLNLFLELSQKEILKTELSESEIWKLKEFSLKAADLLNEAIEIKNIVTLTNKKGN